ncbi:MAG: hypothetical protein ACJ73D_02240 [Pyrinomonadaceae bacterium]
MQTPTAQLPPAQTPAPTVTATPAFPNLQAELLGKRDRETTSPLGKFDFKNYTYKLPHGWQNPDGSDDITLVNGKVTPYAGTVSEDMSDEGKAAAKTQRRIGMSYVTAKYMDLTGDGQDEAVVILKVETEGSAIPQIGYIFSWKNNAPELIWTFRTGDRADGGLKDIRSENGMMVVELYGQDRFLLGGNETGKITDDREQLCCPTYFTRSFYKWNGSTFLMQGKRLTYSMGDPHATPLENYGDIVNNPQNQKSRK